MVFALLAGPALAGDIVLTCKLKVTEPEVAEADFSNVTFKLTLIAARDYAIVDGHPTRRSARFAQEIAPTAYILRHEDAGLWIIDRKSLELVVKSLAEDPQTIDAVGQCKEG